MVHNSGNLCLINVGGLSGRKKTVCAELSAFCLTLMLYILLMHLVYIELYWDMFVSKIYLRL